MAIIFLMKDLKSEHMTEAVVDRFTALRKEQGLSHDVVAERTGLNRSTISLIESKKRSPTLKSCLKISHALGYELSDLLKEAQE